MSGCEYLFFVCRSCLRCVAWFSYWFDNLGLITEGNTYRRCAASSLPLWGNTDIASSDITYLCSLSHTCSRALLGTSSKTVATLDQTTPSKNTSVHPIIFKTRLVTIVGEMGL